MVLRNSGMACWSCTQGIRGPPLIILDTKEYNMDIILRSAVGMTHSLRSDL